MSVTSAGARFVHALAAKDTAELLAVLAPDLALRAMGASRFWEASSAEEAVHDVLSRWIEPSDVVERIEAVEEGSMADRRRLSYRLCVRSPDGLFLVEQVGYFDQDDGGRIRRMDVLCSGFRPVPQP
jgi:hypothetical protein